MLKRIQDAKKDEGGFTLIEMLIVIVILAILAAVVLFAVGGLGDRGQSSACRTDARTLATAQEAHYAQNRSYAADATELRNEGYLAEISTLHTVAPSGATYNIEPIGTKCPDPDNIP